MKDEPAYMDEDIVSMPYAPEDDADGHIDDIQPLIFIDRRIAHLLRRINVIPLLKRGNIFLTKANMTYPDSWFKLIYVIERSQPVTLELYEMKERIV